MKKTTFVVLIVATLALPMIGAAGDSAQGTINLNTANAEQLQLLPRVGPSLAARIIEFRDSNGPFRAVDELIAVKGIGEKSLKNMSPYLAVSGETTLADKVKVPRKGKTDNEAL